MNSSDRTEYFLTVLLFENFGTIQIIAVKIRIAARVQSGIGGVCVRISIASTNIFYRFNGRSYRISMQKTYIHVDLHMSFDSVEYFLT